jgi:formylglycine-generating enzyme required for sulfatase activity
MAGAFWLAQTQSPLQASSAEPLGENDGILNGPLTDNRFGHRAEGEGDRESLRLAIEHLMATFGSRYPQGAEFLQRLEAEAMSDPKSEAFKALQREALVDANPAIDFDRILLVRAKKGGKRFAQNWQTQVDVNPSKLDDDLVVLNLREKGKLETIYQSGGKFIGHLDLHFNADRLLFTSTIDKSELSEAPGRGKGYAVFELKMNSGSGQARGEAQVVSPDMGSDVDCYDACYLPDGRILFASTASYEGVPCVGGGSYVANLYRMDRNGRNIRRLTFDQDGNWHPMVMENGRVMYTRWEYTDSAHYFSRVLMTMNPDGTDQKAWYGSNSYWPNSLFFARQIPGNPLQFLAIVSGHHGVAKAGALTLFDVSRGRNEADGAVQFITGRGKKVHPLVLDRLAQAYSPHFLDPFPIDESFYLAVKDQGIWLLDRFDNMVCLQDKDEEGAYYHPVPLRRTKMPPALPDRIRPEDDEATVLINDIYAGPGLSGVPRGTVKGIRVFRYEFGPRHKGGHYAMGMEAGWDAKQVLGMAPVEKDGSASFKVPANTPISLQPVDDENRALQLMRSWTVAMPGEVLSCVGCHESQDMAPPSQRYEAMLRAPSSLEPFYGPTRGFSFEREIQPLLDRYCLSCHDGEEPGERYSIVDRIIGTGVNTGKKFSECGIPSFTNAESSHRELHPYVRRNGPEGDYYLLTPLEFHASTSELMQILEKGHHNVHLDEESKEKLITWIDLNAPYHGTWTEAGAKKEVLDRRKELRKLYAGDNYDPEEIVNPYERTGKSILPEPYNDALVQPEAPRVSGAAGATQTLDLGEGVLMKLVSIPAGEFSMGSNDETPMERPVNRVRIDKEFLIGATEVTLKQYRQFDPDYLNGVYDMHYKDQVHRGYYMNDMDFPVIRVSWENAMAFCEWLSQKTGRQVSLPTEAQWEWACRAGTSTPLSFGTLDANFSEQANLADISLKRLAVKGVNPKPIKNPNPTIDYELKDPRSDDGALHLAEVGSYQPNPWGLYDMHGNAAEWTRSEYRAYPYQAGDGRNDDSGARRVVRGGSWYDRPYRATVSYRLGFEPWHRVYHTGFRVVVE